MYLCVQNCIFFFQRFVGLIKKNEEWKKTDCDGSKRKRNGAWQKGTEKKEEKMEREKVNKDPRKKKSLHFDKPLTHVDRAYDFCSYVYGKQQMPCET